MHEESATFGQRAERGLCKEAYMLTHGNEAERRKHAIFHAKERAVDVPQQQELRVAAQPRQQPRSRAQRPGLPPELVWDLEIRGTPRPEQRGDICDDSRWVGDMLQNLGTDNEIMVPRYLGAGRDKLDSYRQVRFWKIEDD